MKQIMAGSGDCYTHCACVGMSGAWTYTNGCVNGNIAGQDADTYCRNGAYCD